MSLVSVTNADRPGSDAYKKVIEQIEKDSVCPFCPDHLAAYHKNPILKDTDLWTVTTNMYPYENAKHHFLLILKAHKSNSRDISAEEWAELQNHIDWLIAEHDIPGGTFFMRSGDMAGTGATVKHLHAQFVSADHDNPDRKPILARIG